MAGVYVPIKDQPYIEMYSWEEIDLSYWRGWFSAHWPYSVVIGVCYAAFIQLGQLVMRDRQPFDLRGALALWNVGMATFSAFAFFRVFPELFYLLRQPDGLHKAACQLDNHGMTMAFWALTYTLSKALQIGDTVFIVLRKKKLILLHWYHHASVLIIAWFAYQPYIPLLRFVGNMNYFVHFWMYGYYGLRAMDIKISKRVSVFVTILELIQMVLGLGLTIYVIYQHYFGSGCIFSPRAVTVSLAIYSTLFLLFAKHFRSTALRKTDNSRKNGLKTS